jgi:hypothetical protein
MNAPEPAAPDARPPPPCYARTGGALFQRARAGRRRPARKTIACQIRTTYPCRCKCPTPRPPSAASDPERPGSPVVLSVPHAGRAYSPGPARRRGSRAPGSRASRTGWSTGWSGARSADGAARSDRRCAARRDRPQPRRARARSGDGRPARRPTRRSNRRAPAAASASSRRGSPAPARSGASASPRPSWSGGSSASTAPITPRSRRS